MTFASPVILDPLPVASAELLFILLLVLGLTFITAIGFALWLLIQVVRLITSLLTRALFGPPAPAKASPPRLVCPDPVCRSVNPDIARFCRQCGRRLGQSAGLASRPLPGATL